MYNLEKYYKQEKKQKLHTPLDTYKNRLSIQGSVIFTFIVIFGLFLFAYKKIKYRPLIQDTFQVFYTTSEKESFSEANSLKQTLNLSGDWFEYKLSINPPKDIYRLRMDPLNQVKARIQFKNIRILDKNGKILKERDFLIGNDLRPKNFEEIENTNQIIPGKISAGKFIEFVSNGDDPYISINTGLQKSVAEIQITIRVIEAHKKFKD